MIIAKAGEVVTCEQGHEICDVARDIVAGEPIRASSFANWRDRNAPEPLMPIYPNCLAPECSARWFRQAELWGALIHVGDEWRPSRK